MQGRGRGPLRKDCGSISPVWRASVDVQGRKVCPWGWMRPRAQGSVCLGSGSAWPLFCMNLLPGISKAWVCFGTRYVWSLLYLKQVCISPDGPLWSCVMGPLQRGEPRPLRLGGMRVPFLDLLPKAGASGSIWSPFGTSEWAYVWLSAASGAEQPG